MGSIGCEDLQSDKKYSLVVERIVENALGRLQKQRVSSKRVYLLRVYPFWVGGSLLAKEVVIVVGEEKGEQSFKIN